MGALTFASVLVLTASMLALSSANRGWQFDSNYNWPYKGGYHHPKSTQAPKRIVVGGSEGWHFNFTYTDWALKNGPFYLNDSLVFNYATPVDNTTAPHNVYLLPNFRSFLNCDFTGAELVANETQGGGEGFEFVLTKWKPHYFACSVHDGRHCNLGKMKFFVMPLLRWY